MFGKTDIVKFLILKGASKNANDKDSKTPYDLACTEEMRNILIWKKKKRNMNILKIEARKKNDFVLYIKHVKYFNYFI